MTTSSNLHELVLEYRSGRRTKAAIMERVAETVYREPGRFGFDDEDAAADAMLKYRPRIDRLIDRYEDRGVAFDAYLGSCLRFLAKTVRRERRRNAEREQVCERSERGDREGPGAWSQETPGFAETAGEGEAEKRGLRLEGASTTATASRLVFLFLKCVWDADDEDLGRVAAVAKVDPSWLASAATQARRSLESERCRFERMRARRNTAWCRIGFLEARIEEEPDCPRRRSLEQKLARERTRFERARAEIRSFKPTVPNSIVARILGIPKGTVDSGLYYLRRRLESGEKSRKMQGGGKAPAP